MTLAEVVKSMRQHGVNLTLTPTGKLRPTAEREPPAELIEGIKRHRALLVRRLERHQQPDGRYNLEALQQAPGLCASCARWSAAPGELLGVCPLPAEAWQGERPLAIHAAHACQAQHGRGWKPAA